MQMIRSMICLCSMVLVGCGSGSGSGGRGDGKTVTVGPLLCLLSNDTGTGIAPMNVSCDVAIGNASASDLGIKTSVQAILGSNVLPGLCPTFKAGDVLASPVAFSAQLQDDLSQQYVKASASGNGLWTVNDADCTFAAL